MTRDWQMIKTVYAALDARQQAARRVFKRPLTLAEKILLAHLAGKLAAVPKAGETYVYLNPDRVAMQDATAQMALLQLLRSGRERVAVPTSVHCDHLIRAETGARADLDRARRENQEVYDFLKNVSAKHGLGFWEPGSGIIHQVLLENYAFPGGLMIGTDSHTPNAGGLGMLAIGVGGADAVDAMVGLDWELAWPGLIGVHLTGRLRGWASPKDVILKLLTLLSVKGGTGRIVEYFGPGAAALSCTGKATIANMGAELGATASLFPFDSRMADFLAATGRRELAELATARGLLLAADPEVLDRPERYFEQVIELDLDTLAPQVVGPASPDVGRPLAQLKAEALAKGWPTELKVGLIGSCTNSSYEDLGRAAHLARQALAKGLRAQSRLLISPGSERIRATIERDGQLAALVGIGGVVLANACGPCIGQWQRQDFVRDEVNVIVTSFNRNFRGRLDGNPATLIFIASPETVTAMALAGSLTFDPATDTIAGVTLEPPSAADLPKDGFVASAGACVEPAAAPAAVTVAVDPASSRLQLLEPFPPWDGQDLRNLAVLLKARGKCTTDHISPAGKWLQFRGHLDKIADNLFAGATNAFSQVPGAGRNVLTGAADQPLAQIARDYRARQQAWVAIGDENYGEGSSREHAAMEPRYLGGRAVIARSFARIHETNLKKQGLLPLTFADPADYERIQADDRLDLNGLADLAPGQPLTLVVHHRDGSAEQLAVRHSFSAAQFEWFRAGSALNLIATQQPPRG